MNRNEPQQNTLQGALLVVDSAEHMAEHAVHRLRSEGYDVQVIEGTPSTHREVARYIQEGKELPDIIVLCDVAAPDQVVLFLEMLDAMQGTQPLALLCTHYSVEQLAKLPHRIRAVGLVVHPDQPDQLLKTVAAAMQAKRQSQG